MIRNLIEAQEKSFLARVSYIASHPDDPYSNETPINQQKTIKMDLEQAGALDEYLDFMQLVAYLVLRLGFCYEDVSAIFGYWLQTLNAPGPIREYIAVESFEFNALREFLKDHPFCGKKEER